MQQHGRRFEHTLTNGLDVITPKDVYVTTCGYSGNAKADGCDIVVTIDPLYATTESETQYNIELKRRQGDRGKRVSDAFDGSADDETGVDEIRRLLETTPDWGTAIVALKFDHCKLVVLEAAWLLDALGVEDYYVPMAMREGLLDVLSPRVTDGGNVSLIKPQLSDWPSATAAPDDEVVLAERLGLPHEVSEDD